MDVRSKKTPLFLAKDLELVFFETAPAHEIIKYVDLITRYQMTGDDQSRVPYFDWSGKYWSCSKEIEAALASRNDPNIDIALVRIADYAIDDILEKYFVSAESDDVSKSIADNNLSKIILSAVQNRQALTALGGIATWLEKAWEWILENGNLHYQELFLNPNVPDELIENILRGKYDQKCKHRRSMYGWALKCPTTRRGLDDQRHGPDSAAIHRLEAYWNFIAKLDVSDKVLRDSVTESKEKHLPYRIELKDEDFSFPKYGMPGYNRDENYISYLKIFIDNWLKNNESEDDNKEQREFFVEFVCSVFVWNSYSSKVKDFIKNHDVLAVRKGFYRGESFGDESIPEIEGYTEKEGYEFLWSALENSSMYNFRDNKELCFWFFSKISYARLDKTLIGTYDEKFPMDRRYEFKMNETYEQGKDKPKRNQHAIKFKKFDRLFHKWRESGWRTPKEEANKQDTELVVNNENYVPTLPKHDNSKRMITHVDISRINLRTEMMHDKKGVGKSITFYGKLEDRFVIEHLKSLGFDESILQEKPPYDRLIITLSEFSKTDGIYDKESFHGKYELSIEINKYDVSDGNNKVWFFITIYCTESDLESYFRILTVDMGGKQIPETKLYILMVPDENSIPQTLTPTADRPVKFLGNIIGWNFIQQRGLSLK